MNAETETREQRQAKIDARVAELRAQADAKEAEANRLHGTVSPLKVEKNFLVPA